MNIFAKINHMCDSIRKRIQLHRKLNGLPANNWAMLIVVVGVEEIAHLVE